MDENSEVALNKFYQKLYDNIVKRYKKVKENSVIIFFLDKKSNERFRLLSDSSIPKSKIQKKQALDDLLTKNFIRTTDILNEYAITAKGIWNIENKKKVMNEDILLGYLDQKYFNVYSSAEKSLADKQKVILFSMVAARAFSEKSSVDLQKDETAKNSWKEITDESYEKLESLQLISKLKQEDLYGKPGNEKPVSNLFRHTDSLPKQTRGLFRAVGKQKYCLDLYKESRFSNEGLSYLFDQIFDNRNMSYAEITEIYDFCCNIAHTKNIFVFDVNEHIFSKPEYDDVIKETLLSI